MNDQIRPPALRKKPPSWMDRNWKWFIPTLIVGSGTVIAGFFALLFMLVFGIMKSSDAYKDAVARAQAHPGVQAALGTPIEEGLFVTGSINTSGTSGSADFAIPISGPNGKATVYAIATKTAGVWNFSGLIVEIQDTGERLNLLE